MQEPRPWRRWFANAALVGIDSLFLRLVLPTAAVGAAAWADHAQVGLFATLPVTLPNWAIVLLSLLALDLAIWAQHIVMHRVPLLWRLHRVHHSDTTFDTTTALRFHPFEIGLSMLYKMAVVVALGAPVVAVVLFEILLNAAALFNHGNARLPESIDRWLRLVLVTPDMHRVHHSVYREETDSNFGFCLSMWDRLFRTYRATPRDGHDAMRIGLLELGDLSVQSLVGLLLQPFRMFR